VYEQNMNESSLENDGIAQIKVIGVGGGGSNAVSRMFRERIQGVEYLAVNTDAQHLVRCDVPVKVRIGEKLTRGLGVGGNPELGRDSAEESREELYELVRGSDMVFIAAGMGGGTGTGSAPVIAEIAKETGALTIAVVTKPFAFEGSKRRRNAEDGLHKLKGNVDTLIVIPNDRLLELCDEDVTMENAFRTADDVLRHGVQAIAELLTVPGEINLDFADVKSVMSAAGPAWMAIGTGHGPERAIDAARAAVASPLLDVSIDGARGVLFNVTGGPSLTLREVEQAAEVIGDVVDADANIIFGMVTDYKMDEEVRVTIIATDFPALDGPMLQDDDVLSDMIRGSSVSLDDLDLDLPPFLRRGQSSGRRRINNT
jgi:cell division protein FtsZ